MKILAPLALVATLGGAAFADPYPVSYTDERGETITLTEAPQKIAAMTTSSADMLAALGRHVDGTTTYAGTKPVYLGEAVNDTIDLGDLTDPNLELISTEDFDLILGMTRYNAPFSEELSKIANFATFTSNSLDDSYSNVTDFGLLFGAQDEAAKMNADFEALLKEVADKAPESAPSVVFIWNYYDTLYAYTNNILPADLFDRIGAVNPLGRLPGKVDEGSAFMILEAEDLLAHDPDVILIFSNDQGGTVKWNPAYERLTAYKTNRFYSVGYQYSQSGGPIARELVLREMAHLLYPETFDAPDMIEEARATAAKFAK